LEIRKDEKTMEAFCKMKEFGVTDVAVVDDNDKPIRVIATVDLLKLLCEQYQTVQSM